MSTLLYRLGRASYRRAWMIIGVWTLILAAIVGAAVALGGKSQESYVIPGTESQTALDTLSAVFPSVAGASAQVIMVAPDGSKITNPALRPAIDDTVADIRKLGGIDTVLGPFDKYAANAVSDDARIARVQVQFDGPSTSVTPKMLDDLKATAAIGEKAGLRVEFGGGVFQNNTATLTITELFGVIFAALVLVITFGSLLAAGMPLISALVGVGIVVGGISGASAFVTVSSSAPLLAVMIGLAVGIDYSLFIVSRHRGQLATGMDAEESTGLAVGTAGSAVVFAGVTVIIALLGLLVVGIPFLSVMGVAAAFAVLIAIAVATTLVPAILGVAKGRLAPKPGSRAERRAIAHHEQGVVRADGDTQEAKPKPKPTLGTRWVRLVMRAPVVATIGVVVILGTIGIPALSLDLSLPDSGSDPAASTERQAYDLVSDAFGPGYNGPLVVAVDITQTTNIVDDLAAIVGKLRTLDNVSYVSQGIPDAGLDTAIIQVIPNTAPDSLETKALVQDIRDRAPALEREFNLPISVTGATAVGIDISNRLTGALIPFGLIVVGLSVVLLMIVFRSILVPITAALGFLLSVVASFGVVVAVFQWGWFGDLLGVDVPGPVLSFMPIILMAVLFGLAMDYEVFLVSGMREEFVKTGDARSAVERGFTNGARVVTAAALIMFFVFFAFVPESGPTIKSIALGLTVGIVFDAFLIRMTLVPAVMTLLGRSAWWLPAGLAKRLPHLDIEGDDLRTHLAETDWAHTQEGFAVSSAGLVMGAGQYPVDLQAPRGSIVLVGGERMQRQHLLSALSGRRSVAGGLAQVLGSPLPSNAADVRTFVAFADVDDHAVRDVQATRTPLGELLHERLRFSAHSMAVRGDRQLGQGKRGTRRLDAEVAKWVDDIRAALHPHPAQVSESTIVADLPLPARRVVLTALALAEGAPVVALDRGDTSVDLRGERELLAAIAELASSDTTILIGTPDVFTSADAAPPSRASVTVHLDTTEVHGTQHATLDELTGGLR